MSGVLHKHNGTHHPEPSAEAGWSLVEMLVALMLLAVICGMLLNALVGLREAFRTVDGDEAAAQVEAVQMHLRRTLTEAWPAARSESGAPLFDAAGNALGFVSNYSPAGQYAGLQYVRLEVAPADRGDGREFVETRNVFRSNVKIETRPNSRSILLSRITGIRFSYFGVQDEETQPRWDTVWRHGSKLPELIGVDVSFPVGDKRRWPRLIVALPTGR